MFAIFSLENKKTILGFVLISSLFCVTEQRKVLFESGTHDIYIFFLLTFRGRHETFSCRTLVAGSYGEHVF